MAQSSLDLTDTKRIIGERSAAEWKKSDDQYKWAQDQFANNQATSGAVTGRALNTGADFSGYARTDRGDYDRMVRPAMQQQMDFASDYASKGRMDANRASAIGGSRLGSNAAARNSMQSLMSFGVDPSSGRFAGLDAGLQAKAAGDAAAAGTKSDRDTELLGQRYLDNAIARGQVLPGQANQAAATGMAADSLGVNAGLATTASGSSTMGSPIQWEGIGNDMYKQGIMADIAQDASNRDWSKQEAASSSGTGAAIGAGLGILGTVAGSFIPGGSLVGPMLGKMAGSAISGAASGGGGGGSRIFRRGGMVKRYENGGRITKPDDEDMTGQHNTELTPEEELEYQQWAKQNNRGRDVFDYDMRGAWKEGHRADPSGHFPDTYKKPNHPTFSNESRYHGVDGRMGGQWSVDEMDQETLTPHQYAEGGMVDEDLGLSPEERQVYEQYWQSLAPPASPQGYAEGGGVEEEETFGFMGEGGDDAVTSEVEPMEGEDPNMVPPEASPSGGEDVDDVNAMVSVGEFVMPEDVTRWYGEKYFQGLIEKARRDMHAAPAQPEQAPMPQAMAVSPPSFKSEGARA